VNDSNKKLNIEGELDRASSALKAANLLAGNGLYSDGVSRLYYVLLYHVRALLLTRDLEARSHEGALRMLGLHFVRQGQLETRFSHTFSRLMKYREEADYNPMYLFTAEDYYELRDDVEAFINRAACLLQEAGYGTSPDQK